MYHFEKATDILGLTSKDPFHVNIFGASDNTDNYKAASVNHHVKIRNLIDAAVVDLWASSDIHQNKGMAVWDLIPNIAEVHQFPRNSVMKFSEYLL